MPLPTLAAPCSSKVQHTRSKKKAATLFLFVYVCIETHAHPLVRCMAGMYPMQDTRPEAVKEGERGEEEGGASSRITLLNECGEKCYVCVQRRR